MRKTGIAELSPKALQCALYRTTERLAAELASPAAATPVWTKVEWRMARAVAMIHGIAPLLAVRLRWEGPDDWTLFLREEQAREHQRYLQIRELLQRIDEVLRSAMVSAIALKGAALYRAGFYRPGERPMADVDILVRTADLERTAQLLGALGFHESSSFWKNTVFSPSDRGAVWRRELPGEHPIKIELHERICEKLPQRIVDISDPTFPADPYPGLNPYPSQASLMAHLLLHAAGSIVEHALRLIQLNDIALLAGRATAGDWVELMRIGQGAHSAWWAFPPLALTAVYYPECIPAWVLDAAHTACPAMLRWSSGRQTLTSVSLSFPWIEAFPGIAWSSSPREALEYVARRVVRGEEMAVARQLASRTEPGLCLKERQWLAASQGRRVLQWLVSRPTRPLTMRVVRDCFGTQS